MFVLGAEKGYEKRERELADLLRRKKEQVEVFGSETRFTKRRLNERRLVRVDTIQILKDY